MSDLRDFARNQARLHGVNPDIFERQIQQESGFNPKAFNSASGASGIAQIVPEWHPGIDVWNPEESLTYAAKLMAGYLLNNKQSYPMALASFNWGSGNVGGYTKPGGVVVPPWDGRRETLPAETRHYLDVILGVGWPEPAATNDVPGATNRVAFSRDAPVDPQPDDWSCSVQSAQWLLRAVGRNPARAWLEQQLVGPLGANPVVSREYGLMDATGRTLARWLQTEYGNEMGLTFAAQAVNSWDDIVAFASKGPLMLGGRTFNHWTGVRAYRDGKVLLANPAGSWKGVGQELTRDEFDALGSWSAITATLPQTGVGNGPSTTNDEDTIHGLRVALAHIADVEAPRLALAAAERDAAMAAIKRIREQYLGSRP